MANSWFTSDLHEGHRNIGKFRRLPQWALDESKKYSIGGVEDSTIANSIWIDYYWRKEVKPKDKIRCLGDNAFTEWGIDQIAARPGQKEAYGGNHDDLPLASYMRAFGNIRGCEKVSRLGWVSHFPLHPDELRGNFSIHGHVHYQTINDWKYINVCCDNLFESIGSPIIHIDQLKAIMDKRRGSNIVEY